MVLDMKYNQGLLPGVPRFGGLAPHPVAWACSRRPSCSASGPALTPGAGSTWLAWVVGLGVLFFAQSKTAWIAFVLCSIALVAVRSGPGMLAPAGRPERERVRHRGLRRRDLRWSAP